MTTHELRIFSYNQSYFLKLFFEKLLLHNVKPNKVVVFDDCSSDDTDNTVSEYQKKLAAFGCEVELEKNAQNQGIYKNYNRGFISSPFDYIHFCSGDDYYCENYFENLNKKIDALKLDPNKKIVLHSNYFNEKNRILVKAKNNYRDDPIAAVLQGKFTFRCQGMSRGFLKNSKGFRDDIGVWADLLWEVNALRSCDALYYCDVDSHIYRSGIGYSSKQDIIENYRSQSKALQLIGSEVDITIEQRKLVDYLLKRNQLLLNWDYYNLKNYLKVLLETQFRFISVQCFKELVKRVYR